MGWFGNPKGDRVGAGTTLRLVANLGAASCPVPPGWAPAGRRLAAVGPASAGALGPWHVAYYLAE